jgi:hypothetical protein
MMIVCGRLRGLRLRGLLQQTAVGASRSIGASSIDVFLIHLDMFP